MGYKMKKILLNIIQIFLGFFFFLFFSVSRLGGQNDTFSIIFDLFFLSASIIAFPFLWNYYKNKNIIIKIIERVILLVVQFFITFLILMIKSENNTDPFLILIYIIIILFTYAIILDFIPININFINRISLTPEEIEQKRINKELKLRIKEENKLKKAELKKQQKYIKDVLEGNIVAVPIEHESGYSILLPKKFALNEEKELLMVNGKVFEFKDVLGSELEIDGYIEQSSYSSAHSENHPSLSRGLLGQAMFGTAGAVVGSLSGKTTTKVSTTTTTNEICNSIAVKIKINNLHEPLEVIELIIKPIQKRSNNYINLKASAERVNAIINLIAYKNLNE